MKLILALVLVSASIAPAGGVTSAGATVAQSVAGAFPSTVTVTATAPADAPVQTETQPPAPTAPVAAQPEAPAGPEPAAPQQSETPAAPTAEEQGVGVGGDPTVVYPDNCLFVFEGLPVFLTPFTEHCREQQLAAESIVANAPANISFSVTIAADGDETYSTQINGFTVATGGPVPDALINTYDALDKAARS